MFYGNTPVVLGDAESGVGGFHVASGVDAGAAGGAAEEVNHMLAQLFLRVCAQAGEETMQLRVAGEASDKIVGNGGNGVVAAEPVVKTGWWLLCARLRRCGKERSRPRPMPPR